nr:hypothetical protein [Pirellula staleyi]
MHLTAVRLWFHNGSSPAAAGDAERYLANSNMKQRRLDRIANELLGPCLIPKRFVDFTGGFCRAVPSGAIHTILIGHDVRSSHSFQILCGLNATVLCDAQAPQRAGVFGGRQLTRDGWSANSGRWPCHDEDTTRASFVVIQSLIDDLVEPWFQTCASLASVADAMSVNQHGLLKARLYHTAGCTDDAVAAAYQYLERLRSPASWDDPKWLITEIETATIFVREIEFSSQGERAK